MDKIFRQCLYRALTRHRFYIITRMLLVTTDNSENMNQEGAYSWLNLDTVKAGKFDMGKMWTFDYPLMNTFKKNIILKLHRNGLIMSRKSALRFANYCSASFVSADGLVMTNDHCGQGECFRCNRRR